MQYCTIENCERPIHGRGLCNYHYGKSRRTPTYNAFFQSKSRCTNKNHPRYKDYGGRGIKMCDRWAGANGYKNFLEDMGERPDGKTLDRANNNGDYEPSNCRWVDYQTQNLNKRDYSNNKSGVVGVSYHKASGLWGAHIRIRGAGRISYHHTKEDAIQARLRAELDREV